MQTDATTPNIAGTYSASCEGYIRLCKPCVRSVLGPNNVGRAVQTDPPLLRHASVITQQKKCWELLAEKFDRFQTLRNNAQQHPTTCNKVCKRTQHVTSNNVGSCRSTMLRPFARSLRLTSFQQPHFTPFQSGFITFVHREEKSSRHVAMVAKFLDDNKLKTSLKT